MKPRSEKDRISAILFIIVFLHTSLYVGCSQSKTDQLILKDWIHTKPFADTTIHGLVIPATTTVNFSHT